MKKQLFLGALFAAILIFSGCRLNVFQKVDNNKNNEPITEDIKPTVATDLRVVPKNPPSEDDASFGYSHQFSVLNNEEEVTVITLNSDAQIWKQYQKDQYYYVEFIQTETGWAAPFPLHGDTWRISRQDFSIEYIGDIYSISSDERYISSIYQDHLVFTDLETRQQKTFGVNINISSITGIEGYTDNSFLAEAIISPDAHYMVFTEGVGGMGADRQASNLSILDTATGKYTVLLNDREHIQIAREWKNNTVFTYGDSFGSDTQQQEMDVSSAIETLNTNAEISSITVEDYDPGKLTGFQDAAGMHTFFFPELGFSIPLPFTQDQITAGYWECDETEACDEFGYQFSGNLKNKDSSGYTFLGSVSEHWSPSIDSQLSFFHDFSVIDESTLRTDKAAGYTIHPLKTVSLYTGEKAYIFDVKKDYYDYLDAFNEKSGLGRRYDDVPEQYGVVFKVKNSSQFKAVLLAFNKTDLSLEQLEAALEGVRDLQTIRAFDTSDWKTYENNTMGLRFLYPVDWKVEQSGGDHNTTGDEIQNGQVKTPFQLDIFATDATEPTFQLTHAYSQYDNAGLIEQRKALYCGGEIDRGKEKDYCHEFVNPFETLFTDTVSSIAILNKKQHLMASGKYIFAWNAFVEPKAIPYNDITYATFYRILNSVQISKYTPLDSSNWQVYENSNYGISFTYPKDWNLNVATDDGLDTKLGDIFLSTPNCLIQLSRYPQRIDKKTVEDLIAHAAQALSASGITNAEKNVEKINVHGIEGIKYILTVNSALEQGVVYELLVNDYVITALLRTGPTNAICTAPFIEMMNSISPASSVQAYENKTMGFSLRYPTDWSVQEGGSEVGLASPETIINVQRDPLNAIRSDIFIRTEAETGESIHDIYKDKSNFNVWPSAENVIISFEEENAHLNATDIQYYIQRGSTIFSLTYIQNSIYQGIVQSIVDSFKIITD